MNNKILIFELENVLLNTKHRSQYEHDKETLLQHAGMVIDDTINPVVLDLLLGYQHQGYSLYCITKIKQDHLPVIMGKLQECDLDCTMVIPKNVLDGNSDHHYKQNLLDILQIRDRVAVTVESDQKCCDMWRRNGIQCIQVDPTGVRRD